MVKPARDAQQLHWQEEEEVKEKKTGNNVRYPDGWLVSIENQYGVRNGPISALLVFVS